MSRAKAGAMRAAVYELADQGLAPTEIMARLDFSRSAIYRYLAERQAQLGEVWTRAQLARLRRIHDGAMGVIAEAFSVDVVQIRAALVRLGEAVPAELPAALEPVASVASETQAKTQPAAGAERVYRFVEMGGQFLRQNGRGFTDEPGEAWSGTAEQVRDQRPSLRDAKHCKTRLIQ